MERSIEAIYLYDAETKRVLVALRGLGGRTTAQPRQHGPGLGNDLLDDLGRFLTAFVEHPQTLPGEEG